MHNIYELPLELPNLEIFEAIASSQDVLIERIISTGQTTPKGQWYDQERDEWVILLKGEAEIAYDDDTRVKLQAGDYLMIPKHQKHRVEYTSSQPPCIWLAVHGKLAT
ncbi:cupin domain-containing protein [Pseudanabaena sp. ABRG5-3]|uniref:cupin domain-containing protein n=1 Tax=Pseudanabaena sp. ABRG5-3 TaxID=685565 RepID=UPI000DC6DE29|nr:cupin domain-containing protein [Pseudanabaena sp. ABRG5-3]BBC27072.1 cupin domain protein [Pseudanabaena sp. ABRG5-3]